MRVNLEDGFLLSQNKVRTETIDSNPLDYFVVLERIQTRRPATNSIFCAPNFVKNVLEKDAKDFFSKKPHIF